MLYMWFYHYIAPQSFLGGYFQFFFKQYDRTVNRKVCEIILTKKKKSLVYVSGFFHRECHFFLKVRILFYLCIKKILLSLPNGSLDTYGFLSVENYFKNPVVNWNNTLYFVLTYEYIFFLKTFWASIYFKVTEIGF